MDNDLERIKQIAAELNTIMEQMSLLDSQLWVIVNKHKNEDRETLHTLFNAMPESHAKFKLFNIMEQRNFI